MPSDNETPYGNMEQYKMKIRAYILHNRGQYRRPNTCSSDLHTQNVNREKNRQELFRQVKHTIN